MVLVKSIYKREKEMWCNFFVLVYKILVIELMTIYKTLTTPFFPNYPPQYKNNKKKRRRRGDINHNNNPRIDNWPCWWVDEIQ